MARYRIMRTDFWRNPIILEEMSQEDKLFYVYLLSNSNTTQIGIYRITTKEIAFELGSSIERVDTLMERFINHYQLIRYNSETRELAIKNWGKYNLQKGGKPVIDCIKSELSDVEDASLIPYVSEAIKKEEIRRLFDSFCKHDVEKEISHLEERNTYPDNECNEVDSAYIPLDTKLRQKENTSNHSIETFLNKEDEKQKTNDVKEIIEFWDNNGFGFSNVNGKQQLLAWLDDSSFLQPKDVVLKALAIACSNNKRKLNYVVGILKNWENESLLTVEEIDSYHENHKP
ncbi:MAG TPA: DnaD domain protein [Metabacillus sp.]|nr:DnaD domain protein [Metabacillus sp.]